MIWTNACPMLAEIMVTSSGVHRQNADRTRLVRMHEPFDLESAHRALAEKEEIRQFEEGLLETMEKVGRRGGLSTPYVNKLRERLLTMANGLASLEERRRKEGEQYGTEEDRDVEKLLDEVRRLKP